MRALFCSPRFWLWLVVAFGVGCRFYGLNWDEGSAIHPDERFCASLVPQLACPSSAGLWFDSAHSPFNPDNIKGTHYVYGQLPLLLAKVWSGARAGSEQLVWLRALSALFDGVSVVFTILIGRRLLGATSGLLAGAFVALAALNVQGSHFFTTDSFAATFLTLAFWSGARWVETRRAFDALLLGAFWGASLACKLSGALFGVAFFAFVLLGVRTQGLKRALLGSVPGLIAALITFRVVHPMGFVGAFGFFDVRPDPRFWNDVTGQLAVTRGEADVPFNVQWIGRALWLFSLANLGWWGWGWPMLLSGLGGAALALGRPRRAPVLFVAALFALLALGVQGAQFSKFSRYFVPLSPIFALLASYLWREVVARQPKWKPLVGAALAYSLLWCASVSAIYGRRQPRLEASAWIVANIPPGTRVANETAWDEGLPISWIPSGNGGLNSQLFNSFDLDTPAKRADLEATLNASEWIFLSSGRSWRNIPRWPQKWPLMTQFYAALFDGRLGFQLERQFSNPPGFGSLRVPDDGLEEALSVYDHPRVLLFHKRPDYSPTRVAQLLDSVALPSPDAQFEPRLAPARWESLPQPQFQGTGK